MLPLGWDFPPFKTNYVLTRLSFSSIHRVVRKVFVRLIKLLFLMAQPKSSIEEKNYLNPLSCLATQSATAFENHYLV